MIKLEKLPYGILVGAHMILTLLFIVAPFLIKIYFLAAIFYFLLRILSSKDGNQEVILACAYLVALEVFLRMKGALFFYELMKYLLISFMILGIIFKGFSLKSIPYVFYLLLLIPSIVIAAQFIPLGESLRKAIAFNLSGPVALGVAAIYCYQRSITQQRLDEILKITIQPIIMITLYLFLVTPDIRDIVTNTASNFATSGGYGPNQVATVLGIGMFIAFVRFLRVRNLITNIVDILLLLGMTYRAWVTFSRGGVYTSFLMMIAVIITLFILKRSEFRVSFLPKLAVIAVGLIFAWGFTSLVTNGLIDKRYANQDAAGRAKEDLTTGRSELISVELAAFLEKPIAGIGAGQVKYYRAEKEGVVAASHNEVSRLLSEHGAIGIFSLLVLIFTPLIFRLYHKGNIYFYAFLIFWFATINHAAMRIAAPAFFYGIALLRVTPLKTKSLSKVALNPADKQRVIS